MSKRKIAILFAVLAIAAIAIVACSSSDPYEPPPAGERPRGFGGQGGGMRGAMAGGEAGMLELLPPANWWRDDRIAPAVNLTSDQLLALDKIYDAQHDDIARLQRDTQVAVRQLRDSVSLEQPKAEDIAAAGQRVRTLRDDIFDRQLKMLADERLILSAKQWTSLEDALQSARSERQQDRGRYPGGRGRGGFGGRRPGGWGF